MYGVPGVYVYVMAVLHYYYRWYYCLLFSVARKETYGSCNVFARSRLRVLLLYRLQSEAIVALL